MNKTISIVLLSVAALILLGQISINIAQHHAEAFSQLPVLSQAIYKLKSQSGGNSLGLGHHNAGGNSASQGIAQ